MPFYSLGRSENLNTELLYLENKIQMIARINNLEMDEFIKLLRQYSQTSPKSYEQLLNRVYEILAKGHLSFPRIYDFIYEKVKESFKMPTGNYANLFKDLNNLTLTWTYAPKFDKNDIKDVIYNNPATIVFWKDGTKTVVKCQKGDTYNPELGLAMCIIKKMCNNKGNYNDVFNKWLPAEE